MCTSYEANPHDRFDTFTIFAPPIFSYEREIYKDYLAPIFRRVDGRFCTDPASFGMVPRKRIAPGIKVFDTMNARSESVGERRSYSGAWNRQQLCLIPVLNFYEPNYETGKPVRWRIGLASAEPMAIAGLWRAWNEPDGTQAFSFTMLTVNADNHPLMKRFHKPGDEKRSVVIIDSTQYEDWLSCRNNDEARSFLTQYPAEALSAEAAPLVRKPLERPLRRSLERPPKQQLEDPIVEVRQGSLFD
jgi:putative SOS response-associated peptidase YedK